MVTRMGWLAAGLLTAALLPAVAGCANGTGSAAPASTAPGPSATEPPGACRSELVLTEADTGTFCVARGGMVYVLLKGGPDQEWRPVQATGEPLQVVTTLPVPSSASLPPSGSHFTVGAFLAVQAGTSSVTSSRRACPPSSPATASCQAIQSFEVTVTVN